MASFKNRLYEYSLTPDQMQNPSEYCSLGECPLDLAWFNYLPSLGFNLAYGIVFALLLIPQLILVIRYRTWAFSVGIICGLVLEILGYAGRVQLHFKSFPFEPFLLYLICLTIAPVFLSASIYLCLGRVVVVYGEDISRIRPRTYTLTFVSCDIISLALQAAGGGIVAGNVSNPSLTGTRIMIAGLSTQVASLALFMILSVEFMWRVRRSNGTEKREHSRLRRHQLWKYFLLSLTAATVAIFIRCVYRVIELSSGFNGKLFNDQTLFLIFEGPMVIIASLCLTIFHPGLIFATH